MVTTIAQPGRRPIVAGATAAARQAVSGHAVRTVPFAHLFRHGFEIEALGAAAFDANPGYRPTVIASYVTEAGLAGRVRLVLVHDSDGVLRAFAPIVAPTLASVLSVPRALLVEPVGNATPLIDRDAPEAAVALVEAIAGSGGVRFEGMPVHCETAAVLHDAVANAAGVRSSRLDPSVRMVLDCASRAAIEAGIDADFRADLAGAEAALSDRFGALSLERLDKGPAFANAFGRYRRLARQGGTPPAPWIEQVARGQEDDACLVLHELRAGEAVLAMALGLTAGDRYAGLGAAFDRTLAAATAPPVFAVKLAEALADDPSVFRASGGTTVVSPSWGEEETAGMVIGAALQVEAEKTVGRLARLLRERRAR